MKKIYLAAFCSLLLLFAANLKGAELVRKGKGCCVIVIASDAPAQLVQAAAELQKFLFRISGAEIPVVTPSKLPRDTVKISVGENSLTRSAGYKMPEFRGSGYDILVRNDLIVLNGPVFRNKQDKSLVSHEEVHKLNLYQSLSGTGKKQEEYTDFGPMHAVSAFLEHLGVRFYAPGEKGTFIPQKKNISLKDMRITREAAFAVREYIYSPDREIDPELKRHLKFLKSGSSQPPVGLFLLAPVLREGGKKHPSWLALKSDGTPYEALEPGGYPRYSDPSFRKKCWEELKKFITSRPFLREILILPPASLQDFIHIADEEKYRKKVYPSTAVRDIPVEFYLYLARKTAKHFPGVRLLYRSGSDSLPDPALLKKYPRSLGGVPSNMGVTAYASQRSAKYFLSRSEKFVRAASAEKIMVREYWNEYDVPELPRRGYYFSETLQDLRRQQKSFVKGFLIDLPFDAGKASLAEPAQMHFLLYVNSKLLWDPETDIKSLEEEYCRLYFGPASEEMGRFLRMAEKSLRAIPVRGLSPFFAPQLQRDAETLRSLLEQAVRKTAPGSVFRKRVKEILASHSWMKKDIFSHWKKKNAPLNAQIMPFDTPQDGDLAKYAKWYPLSSDDNSAPRTEAAFALSENRYNLFAAFRCYEPQMNKLTARAKMRDDQTINGDDHITITVKTAFGGKYVLKVNSAGVILDSSSNPGMLQYTGSALNWNSTRNFAKVRRYADRWEVELSMTRCGRPPAPGSRFPWKIQLERSRFVSGKEQRYFLSGKGVSDRGVDVYFPLTDAEGRKINGRYNSVNIPIPGIPDGLIYRIPRKKSESVGFTPGDWEGKSWSHVKEGRLGNKIFYLWKGFRYVPDVRFKMQYDERALYVFYRVREKGIRGIHHKDQDMVCRDSCVELFLRPAGSRGKHYMNFEMNCIGTLLLAQVEIQPKSRIKLHYLPAADLKKIRRHSSLKNFSGEIKEETVWFAGLEIPWELVTKYTSVPAPGKGDVWSGNVYKCADWSRTPHWLAWKKIQTFHLPEEFGQFVFE